MKPGDIEIKWEMLSQEIFDALREKVLAEDLISTGLSFLTQQLPLNVSYENEGFKVKLEEKFILVAEHKGVPYLRFVKYDSKYGVELPFAHYGYISPDWSDAIVFAESFGIFKSVISGFASALVYPDGYIPAHASVLQIGGRGVLFVGGSGAGKTTTLLNLIESLRFTSSDFGILTDDWAIIGIVNGDVVAKTFDPSISLRQKDLDENPNMKFHRHDELVQGIRDRVKVSLSPSVLYGVPANRENVKIDVVILLNPVEGDNILHYISADNLASSAIEAAYHYPYVSALQMEHHKKTWCKIAKMIPAYSFYTRSYDGIFQDLSAIREVITL